MTLVIHQKDGSTHGHLLLPEWQQDHILDSRFSWIRLEKLARLEEIRLGHALIAGRHDRSITKALRKDGKHQEAKLIDALVPEQPADKPRAAYTSQSHRMAERQGLDLPQLKQLVDSLWSQSDNLKAFRAALQDHHLTMREGDRAEKRPGAHIIETSDGKLIGSFTRLTKVKMVEFRRLLAEEQQQTVRKPETDIKRTRLPIRRTTADFYEEYPIPKGPDVQVAPRKRPIIKHPQIPKWQRELWLKRMADIDIPPTEPFSSSPPVHIISAEEARFRKEIRKAIAQQQAILDQKAPEASWKPLDREKTITTWRRQLAPYQRQLRKSFDRYIVAKREWQAAEQSLWQRMTGNARKLEKKADDIFWEFLEVLRFVVQVLLQIVGLRSEAPDPICTILSKKSKRGLERFKETHEAEFSAMANVQNLERWLDQYFDNINQARQRRIAKWDTIHRTNKEEARRQISLLVPLLNSKPLALERADLRRINIIPEEKKYQNQIDDFSIK
ncbi:hypothetical protein [Acetobacter tropicalis]|uniref:hypothetical protein n=1 Tax=Acetobacter tropicalis TaxID=104102 RepID=UPI0020CC4202|nr:hypothetical protein [Acetobacter tropicalis]